MMMNRRLFLRLLLALSAAVGMSGSVLLLLERLGLLDSAQRPQIEAQRAEFEKAARKANTIEGAIVSRDGIPFTSASPVRAFATQHTPLPCPFTRSDAICWSSAQMVMTRRSAVPPPSSRA